MKKLLLSAVAILIACAASGQVLYSISGNGLKKESYIVGTHHLVDASFAKEIPGMDKAMKMTKQVYGELKMGDMMNPDTMKMMQEALYIPDGRKIKELLGDKYFDKLNKLFASLLGVPFDTPQLYEQLGGMRPSALESQLTALMYWAKNQGAFDPATNGLDSYFQQQAIANKKETFGLETYAFQVEMMYGSKPIDEEVDDFKCLLDNIEESMEQLDMLTEAYKAQDVTKIEKVMKMEDSCSDKDTREKLIDERNKNWVAIMPKIMKEKPTLFVVGAGHLFGENGVLELLRKAGYTIKAIEN